MLNVQENSHLVRIEHSTLNIEALLVKPRLVPGATGCETLPPRAESVLCKRAPSVLTDSHLAASDQPVDVVHPEADGFR